MLLVESPMPINPLVITLFALGLAFFLTLRIWRSNRAWERHIDELAEKQKQARKERIASQR